MGKWLSVGLKLAPLVIGAVHAVEKFITGIKGKDKQDAAVNFAGEVLMLAEGVTGRDLLDDEAVQAATRTFIDAYVALQNVIAARAAAKLADAT